MTTPPSDFVTTRHSFATACVRILFCLLDWRQYEFEGDERLARAKAELEAWLEENPE